MNRTRSVKASAARSEILGALMRSGRSMSRASLLFRHVIAAKAGLHVTDAECMDFLLEARSATAGQLAKVTGLTTGAMTAAIDRLEKAGFVRRERDPSDRRKVVVCPVMEEVGRFVPFYESMVREVRSLYARYTDAELRFLIDHTQQMTAIYEGEIAKMRSEQTPSRKTE